MSRIGKKPILIPEDVKISIEDQEIDIKGPKGRLSRKIRPEIGIEKKENQILLSPKMNTKQTSAFWGMERALLNNMIKGVTEGYQKQLEIRGLGYRASIKGDTLSLQVGLTHPVEVRKPEGIDISVKGNTITVSGIDKQKVGETAAKIRQVAPPEPYKGKGIRYKGEKVRRKVGKKVATTEL